MIAGIEHWLAGLYGELSYGHIVLLMAMEASLFPVPAELVVLPAGYLAAQGQMDPVLAVLSGTAGSLIGSFFNYLLGRTIGRPFLIKYGKYLLINEHHYEQAEKLFLRNAALATFLGRLLPVIRHLISLPAGVFGMNKLVFALATAAGAGLLCGGYVTIGYRYGEQALEIVHANMPLFIAAVLIVPALYAAAMLLRRTRRAAS